MPEQLFIQESGNETDIALYIQPGILEHLDGVAPEQRSNEANFEAYCIALEGVSHFVLYVFRSVQELQVTALELELQAEIDKFVTAWEQRAAVTADKNGEAKHLSRIIFDNYELRAEVAPEEVDRYHVATRAAKRYCQKLVTKYGRDQSSERMHRDVREYYRLGLADKLRVA
ncbi:MAG: hypothetical protein H7Z43_13385 [Clostridia bacterium]|nr:hypothetical protein [Deltaproteobacteria bacterium]